jgi:predicted phosphodiesterase
MTKRICIIPDTQLPYDDRRALRALIRYIGDTQPDEVIHIGDVMDYPTPSRWSKGSAEEFAKLMVKHNEHAKTRLFGPLREVYDGPIKVHEGNHDLRPRAYLERYAPALAEFEGKFHISELLDFDGFGVELLPDFYRVAPGTITTHGHVGKISLSPIAGGSAARAADRFNESVVMGHTHRAGIIPKTKGYGGRVDKVVWGMEVGHLMDMRQAAYLDNATGNWQKAFGLLTVSGQYVKHEVVPITNKFVVDGETWRVAL